MATRYSHFLQWDASEKYVSLEQTNVRLSGNIRCVICSDGRTGFESIDSSTELASLEYKGFVANMQQGYLTNLATFANKLKKLNQLHTTIDTWTSTTKFVEQFNTIYNYGAYRQQNDLFNPGGLRFFAPIWTYGTLPDRFIILRVSNNLIDHVSLANQGEVVAQFDLRPTTEIGKYLRTLLTNSFFTKSCCEFDPELGYGWTGIDPYAGNIHTAYEHNVESYLANERTLLEQDNAVSNGWMRNNLIVHNLLNLDFSFNDPSAKFGFNTYIGLYINEQDIDEKLLYTDKETGLITSKYNERTLIVSENPEEVKRFVPPTDANSIQDWNKPLEDSVISLGSAKHIVDTEFEIMDPFAWAEFNTIPVIDNKIQVIENDEILFDYTIQRSDIKATIEQTLSSIASNMSLSDVNQIGLYAEYWQNKLILYFPQYEKGKTNYEISVPPLAKLNKSINGDTIFAPFVHDAKTDRYFTGSDSFIIDEITYKIEDAFQIYEGNWFIRTENASQEVLDQQSRLVFYQHVPQEFKIFVPITHARFQLENEDVHSSAIAPLVATFKDRIARTLYNEQYWNSATFTKINTDYPDIIMQYGFLPFDMLVTNIDEFSKSVQESIRAANSLIQQATESSENLFIGGIDQETGFPSEFISNPYSRFNEDQALVSRNLNKAFPFIARMANPFGHDATLLHYYNNIALQYNLHNFVPILHTFKDPSTYTHDWFLLEGDVQDGQSTDILRYYKASNPDAYVVRDLTETLAYSGSYFFKTIGSDNKLNFWIFDKNGSQAKHGLFYRAAKDTDDLSTMVQVIEKTYIIENIDGSTIQETKFVIPVNYDYASAFKSKDIDAFEPMAHDIQVTDPVTGDTFTKKEHAWVYMQPLKGSTTLYSAFFMGVEYTFEGSYSGYRFAVLLVSSYKADKQFEIVENTIFKTLVLILYQYVPDSLVTSFNGKTNYTIDRLALYYSTSNLISDDDSSIVSDIEFSTPISLSFNDTETEKSLNGTINKIKIVPNTHALGHAKFIEYYPFFAIDSSSSAYKIINTDDGPDTTPAKNVPLFCITSKDVGISGDFRETVKPLTSYSWFFVLSITLEDGTEKQYKPIKITAQRIHNIQATYFWCEDVTIELYPDGTPCMPDKNLPLYNLILDNPDQLKDHAFYNELTKFGSMEQCVPYEGMFQVETATPNSVYVRSLLNEYWMHIPDELDVEDPVNQWLKPYVVSHNNTKYFTFNPNPTEYLDNFVINRPVEQGAWLQNLGFSLFAHNNLWYMTDKLSKTLAKTAYTMSSTINKRYESISFANMYGQLSNALIPITRISLNIDGGVNEQTYSKQLKISDNVLTFIVSSLGYNGSSIIRQKYVNFLIYRYKFDYAPIFERLAMPCADALNLEQNLVIPKLRKRYVRQVSIYDEELYPIEDDLTLDIDTKPYVAKWNGNVYTIPFAMSPTQVQNIISKLFVYNSMFEVSVKIVDGQANIIEPLFTIIGNLVFTSTMNSDLEVMSPEEITAACKPDVKDILPDNIHIYDHKMIAFERFYRDTFSKQYKCTKLVTTDGRQLDFVLDDQIVQMVDAEYNGLVMLTFEQN